MKRKTRNICSVILSAAALVGCAGSRHKDPTWNTTLQNNAYNATIVTAPLTGARRYEIAPSGLRAVEFDAAITGYDTTGDGSIPEGIITRLPSNISPHNTCVWPEPVDQYPVCNEYAMKVAMGLLKEAKTRADAHYAEIGVEN